MKVNVIPIGNSKGVRIPKAILQQCYIKKYVDLEVEDKHIVIKSFHEKPRKNWEEYFGEMHKHKDDRLLIDDRFDPDLGIESWTW